jgi:predicted permease
VHNLTLIIVCFLLGIAARKLGRLPADTPLVLNSFIIQVSLPALTLLYVHDLRLTGDVSVLASMPWLHFLIAAAFFFAVGKALRLPRKTVGALILTGGLGNTSFLGLPMIEAFYGREGIAYGIIVDQLGSFMVLSTLGITVAGIYSDGRPSLPAILKRIILFPPFIALLLALFLMSAAYPPWLVAVLARLGDTLAPLALFSVGFSFRPGHLGGNGRNLALGLGFKLVLAPLVLAVFYLGIVGVRGPGVEVMLFEAAMPPMITAGIIAAEHDINPPLAGLMVALGIILSFMTLTLWSILLGGV